MSVLFIAVPIALLFAGSALACFFWAVARGQLDDLETPPLRMLQDDDAPPTRRSCAGPSARRSCAVSSARRSCAVSSARRSCVVAPRAE